MRWKANVIICDIYFVSSSAASEFWYDSWHSFNSIFLVFRY